MRSQERDRPEGEKGLRGNRKEVERIGWTEVVWV